MAKNSRMELVDRILDGNLTAILTDLRAEGVPFDEMARRFQVDHDIAVTRETLRRWCHELDLMAVEADDGEALPAREASA